MNRVELTMKEKLIMALITVAFFGVLSIGTQKVNEIRAMHQLEKAEHEVDTMITMQGVYEHGLIVTEDGNEWIWMHEAPKRNGTEVTVIFQTNNLPEKEWTIVNVL